MFLFHKKRSLECLKAYNYKKKLDNKYNPQPFNQNLSIKICTLKTNNLATNLKHF